VAAPALIQRVVKAHQFLIFTTPPNLQAPSPMAWGRARLLHHLHRHHAGQARSADRRAGGGGFAVAPCHGTYFVNVDIGSVGFQGDDADFCREIIEKAGVAAIPVSAFYASAPETSMARFCFAKPDDMLDEAIIRLKRRFG